MGLMAQDILRRNMAYPYRGNLKFYSRPCKPTVEAASGRWEEQYLAPYLFSEYLELIEEDIGIIARRRKVFLIFFLRLTLRQNNEQITSRSVVAGFLLIGGFPELLLTEHSGRRTRRSISLLLQSQRTLRNDAVERAVYKDIPQVFGVDDPMLLERLLYTLAGQLAGLLSPNTICSQLDGLSQPTFDRYLSYLEKAFLVFTLPNYSGNESSVQKRGRKLYFVDGAIRNAAYSVVWLR